MYYSVHKQQNVKELSAFTLVALSFWNQNAKVGSFTLRLCERNSNDTCLGGKKKYIRVKCYLTLCILSDVLQWATCWTLPQTLGPDHHGKRSPGNMNPTLVPLVCWLWTVDCIYLFQCLKHYSITKLWSR